MRVRQIYSIELRRDPFDRAKNLTAGLKTSANTVLHLISLAESLNPYNPGRDKVLITYLIVFATVSTASTMVASYIRKRVEPEYYVWLRFTPKVVHVGVCIWLTILLVNFVEVFLIFLEIWRMAQLSLVWRIVAEVFSDPDMQVGSLQNLVSFVS